MPNYLKKSTLENAVLIKMSLICSLVALNPDNLVVQFSKSQPFTYNSPHLFFEFQLLNAGISLLLENKFYSSPYGLDSNSFKTDNPTIYNENWEIFYGEKKLIYKYVKTFSFFYRYFYKKLYPNDLSTLSTKKLNMVALQSLFIIWGL